MEGMIGYMIPEFPGQTHIWIWREITHLREWGVPIQIFSTRRSPPRDRARHDFADAAEATTTYLWPISTRQVLQALLWAFSRPLGLVRCVKLAITLPVDRRPRWRTVLPLLLPACRFAREADRLGVVWFHSHTCANGAILCMMAKRLLGTPFSMTLNANIEGWGGAMKSKFEDADFTIAITHWLLDQMHRDYPSLSPQQTLIGRVGVDTRKWVPAERPRGRMAGPTRLLTLGRLHACKGHDVLLEAVGLLVENGADVTLELIGEGPERQALEALAARRGLSRRTTFHGSLGELGIIERMRGADIFILASHSEPLGVAYMEAMAMEVATVGTDAGGVREIITHGETGLLVPPKSPDALATAIRSLIQDRTYRDRIARAGRQSIIERFDSRLGAAALYERLFGRRPPGAEHD